METEEDKTPLWRDSIENRIAYLLRIFPDEVVAEAFDTDIETLYKILLGDYENSTKKEKIFKARDTYGLDVAIIADHFNTTRKRIRDICSNIRRKMREDAKKKELKGE